MCKWNALNTEVTRKMFDKVTLSRCAISASMGNERHDCLPIQRFHLLILAQSHVTVANQIVYTAITT